MYYQITNVCMAGTALRRLVAMAAGIAQCRRGRSLNLPLILLAMFMTLFQCGCDGGFSSEIANGYILHKSSKPIVVILRKQGSHVPRHSSFGDPEHDVVIGSKITVYGVTDNYIVGKVVNITNAPYSGLTPAGWFAVKQQSGRVSSGMTLEAVRDMLAIDGVDFASVELIYVE